MGERQARSSCSCARNPDLVRTNEFWVEFLVLGVEIGVWGRKQGLVVVSFCFAKRYHHFTCFFTQLTLALLFLKRIIFGLFVEI